MDCKVFLGPWNVCMHVLCCVVLCCVVLCTSWSWHSMLPVWEKALLGSLKVLLILSWCPCHHPQYDCPCPCCCCCCAHYCTYHIVHMSVCFFWLVETAHLHDQAFSCQKWCNCQYSLYHKVRYDSWNATLSWQPWQPCCNSTQGTSLPLLASVGEISLSGSPRSL